VGIGGVAPVGGFLEFGFLEFGFSGFGSLALATYDC